MFGLFIVLELNVEYSTIRTQSHALNYNLPYSQNHICYITNFFFYNLVAGQHTEAEGWHYQDLGRGGQNVMFESSLATARAVPAHTATSTATVGCTMSVSAPPAAVEASQNIYNVGRRLSKQRPNFFQLVWFVHFFNNIKLRLFVKKIIGSGLAKHIQCK